MGAPANAMDYDDFMVPGEVCLLRQASRGDVTALKAIKDDLQRRHDGRELFIIFMNDDVAIFERSFVITITDPVARELIGAPPLSDGALPPILRDNAE